MIGKSYHSPAVGILLVLVLLLVILIYFAPLLLVLVTLLVFIAFVNPTLQTIHPISYVCEILCEASKTLITRHVGSQYEHRDSSTVQLHNEFSIYVEDIINDATASWYPSITKDTKLHGYLRQCLWSLTHKLTQRMKEVDRVEFVSEIVNLYQYFLLECEGEFDCKNIMTGEEWESLVQRLSHLIINTAITTSDLHLPSTGLSMLCNLLTHNLLLPTLTTLTTPAVINLRLLQLLTDLSTFTAIIRDINDPEFLSSFSFSDGKAKTAETLPLVNLQASSPVIREDALVEPQPRGKHIRRGKPAGLNGKKLKVQIKPHETKHSSEVRMTGERKKSKEVLVDRVEEMCDEEVEIGEDASDTVAPIDFEAGDGDVDNTSLYLSKEGMGEMWDIISQSDEENNDLVDRQMGDGNLGNIDDEESVIDSDSTVDEGRECREGNVEIESVSFYIPQSSSSSQMSSNMSTGSLDAKNLDDLKKHLPLVNKLFSDLMITHTEMGVEPSATSITSSSNKYTLYVIQYKAWFVVHTPSARQAQMRKCLVRRRFREFVNLQIRLERDDKYKNLMQNVKGPHRWSAKPFATLNKELIDTRRSFLHNFLLQLIDIETISFSDHLQEFLAYSSDPHIAYVVPLKSPNIQAAGHSPLVFVERLRDALPGSSSLSSQRVVEEEDDEYQVEDDDDVNVAQHVACSYRHEKESELSTCLTGLFEEMQETEGTLNPDTTRPGTRMPGDGCEAQSDISKEELAVRLSDRILNLMSSKSCTTTNKLLHFLRYASSLIDVWLEEHILNLTSENMLSHYLYLLRCSIWSDKYCRMDGLGNAHHHHHINMERVGEELVGNSAKQEYVKRQLVRVIMSYIPNGIVSIIGEKTVYEDIDGLLKPLQCEAHSRKFVLRVLDQILFELKL